MCYIITMAPNPEIFVIAGPNGAGKSTGAATILPKRFPTERFLNADDIAKALATDSPIASGKVMLRRMHELRSQREMFAFETTLAGKSHARFLREPTQVRRLWAWKSTRGWSPGDEVNH